MFNPTFIKPKRCFNRLCKAPFFKESCQGFNPKSISEIECIMHCSECGDTFAVPLVVSVVADYVNGLPSKPKNNVINKSLITTNEIEDARKALEDKNILSKLNEEKFNS